MVNGIVQVVHNNVPRTPQVSHDIGPLNMSLNIKGQHLARLKIPQVKQLRVGKIEITEKYENSKNLQNERNQVIKYSFQVVSILVYVTILIAPEQTPVRMQPNYFRGTLF